jgi:nicotinate-nucleotide pyrophosphorylase (carboxylating)
VRKNNTWHHLVASSLREDIGSGDLTSNATIEPNVRTTAAVYSKQNGVLAGIQLAAYTFHAVDDTVHCDLFFQDGDTLAPGQKVMAIAGKATSILNGERVALNFLSHLSGIATLTRQFVEKIKGTNARIVDTRKTTPLLRALEKQAVRAGGGDNHRLGLYDMVLIKENHIKATGGITKAVNQTHKYLAAMKIAAKIEIETTNLNEVEEALSCQVDRIMLDNMSKDMMCKAVALVQGRVKLEASGGVTLENVKEIAETGVNYISIGALTQSFEAFDYTLLLDEK